MVVTIAIVTVISGCGGNGLHDNNDDTVVVVEKAVLSEVAVVVSVMVMEPVGVMSWQ